MTEQEFLQHHHLTRNPFSDEDAQTDSVFRDTCISGTFHPSWSKVVGDARQPATSIVFGPKGSGKTAIRLQLKEHVANHNRSNPNSKVFLIELDDFNSYLGPFQDKLSRRTVASPDKVLQSLQLWDHMDAILCEAITPIVDRVLGVSSSMNGTDLDISPSAISKLDRGQKRDFALLATMYDRSSVGTHVDRVRSLRSKLRFRNFSVWLPFAIGSAATLIVLGLVIHFYRQGDLSLRGVIWSLVLGLSASWAFYAYRWVRQHRLAGKIAKHLRVVPREVEPLRKLLLGFSDRELEEQPLPISNRTDDRYAILEKLQLLLRSLGYPGLIVIVDRVDEPDLVNGQAERMKLLVWPLLDNKLLKHENFGIKMLLPSELQYFIDRETREFHERARLDKQNVVPSFDWTGEALYDLLGARMKACTSGGGQFASPKELFDPQISENRLINAFQSLRTPRNLFRFMYRLIAEHCKRYRSEAPQYQISMELFESTLAVVQADDRRSAI